MDDDKKLAAERSLEIIRDAIWRSRRDVMNDAATPMIVWGVLICITGIVVSWAWGATGEPLWNLLWVVMGGIGWCYYLINLKRRYDGGQAPTFASQVIRWTWMYFAMISVFAVIFSCIPNKAAHEWPYVPIYPIVMLLFALASAVQTTVMDVKENYGFSAMSLMGAGWALQDSGTEQAFDMAMVGLVCLVVPGIVIKYKVWKQNGERETERTGEP